MTLKQIGSLGRELVRFLALFVGCFRSRPGIALLRVSVPGLLSDEQRQNVEAIALRFGKAPRTLQRFWESIPWDEARLRDQCQELIAREHAHANAIGCLDEQGTIEKFPRTARRPQSCEVQSLATYSPRFRRQSWQRDRIKDTHRGPAVWEVKWSVLWRKDARGLPGRRHCLIVARNVLTGEIKYFVSNRVPGDHAALAALCGLRPLVGGELLPTGERRTGTGSLGLSAIRVDFGVL